MTDAAEIPGFPAPDDSPLWKPFWDATGEGQLVFMRCTRCGNAFLPAREECPNCLSPGPQWERASGGARLISWVVYHRAPDAAFQGRVPYTAAIVELDEGPRMITNIVGAQDPEALQIEQRLSLRIEQEDGVAVPRFVPA
ncbi:OB-fold domain-containing protein [Sphingomonas oligophenolica]|uniref:OB-fold domain-containing protein n=1 Tax=Sphingomonas oligophenolica TaxID=301154 RepID=A0ABU9YB54_9SPHN